MTGFPLPHDEAQRLAALFAYEVLDSPPEPAFERITALVSRLLKVPVAMVSLVDAERQWLKSARGIEMDEAGTPRELTFCTHAIMSDEVFIVSDATRDPLFAGNPFVAGPPGVRFYAGAPLRTPDGAHRLGALCILDFQPRELSAGEVQTLRDLAAVVVDELELRRETRLRARAETELVREQSRRYRQLVEQASDGFFIHDFEGRLRDVNQAACDLSGHTREELLGMSLDALVVGFDLEKLRPRWEAIVPGRPLTIVGGHRRKDGSTYPVEVRLSVFQDPEAEEGSDPRRLLAMARDMTERQRREDVLREANAQLEQRVLERTESLGCVVAELREAVEENSRLAAAVESVSLGVTMVDARTPERPIIYANPAFARITGHSREESLGRNCNFLQGPGTDPTVTAGISAAIQAGQPFHATLLNYRRDGTPFWNEMTISPVVSPGQSGRPTHFIGVQVDVTERRQVEERLRLLESAVVHAHDGIIITEIRGKAGPEVRIRYVNRALERMTGYGEGELVGQSPHVFWKSESCPVDWAHVGRRLHRGEAVHLEMINHRRDGSEFWVELDLVGVTDERGDLSHTVGIQRDITERKQAEGALRTSESRYRQLFGTNPLPTWVYDLETLRFLEVNPAAVAHYGYTREEFLAMSLSDILVPEEVPVLMAIVTGQAVPPKVSPLTWRHRRKDGQEIVVETAGDSFTFAGRRARLEVVNDVTEKLRTERALRESQARYQRVTANVPGMVYQFVLRADGSMALPFVSEGCRDIYEKSPEEVQADVSALIDVMSPEDRPAYVAAITESAATLQPWRWEGSVRLRPDGPAKHLQGIARPERLENGDTLWDGVILDVTERKRADQMRLAMEAAERANAAKSEFLSRMSHELRTPLNAILGFGQILEIETLSPRQAQSVTHILQGGRHLLGLVNEVLDISRIEAGHLAFSLEPVEIGPLLRETLGLAQPLTTQRNIRLHGAAEEGPGGFALADAGCLKQILLNLLSNAVKYNRDGGEVELRCAAVPSPAGAYGPGRVRFSIRDTGRGIAPELLAKLFTPFERLGETNGPIEGTGLGLAVSKRLTDAMGGTLGVESTPGVGSTFWVELPRAVDPVPRETSVPEVVRPALPIALAAVGHRLLYIEDNVSNLRLVERILERQRPDWELLIASTGQRGLEVAWAALPELILLDLQLPDLPGDAVLVQLRADPRSDDIPVILLSADANPRSRARLLAAGANAYLTKPLDVRAFLDTMDQVLPAESPGTTARPVGGESTIVLPAFVATAANLLNPPSR